MLGKASGFLQEGNKGTGALRYLKISQSLFLFALVLSFYDILKVFVSFFPNILLSDFCLNNLIITAITDVLIPTMKLQSKQF